MCMNCFDFQPSKMKDILATKNLGIHPIYEKSIFLSNSFKNLRVVPARVHFIFEINFASVSLRHWTTLYFCFELESTRTTLQNRYPIQEWQGNIWWRSNCGDNYGALVMVIWKMCVNNFVNFYFAGVVVCLLSLVPRKREF